MDIDFVEINSESGGIGTVFLEHFIRDIHMEVTGTKGDYGYIEPPPPPLFALRSPIAPNLCFLLTGSDKGKLVILI